MSSFRRALPSGHPPTKTDLYLAGLSTLTSCVHHRSSSNESIDVSLERFAWARCQSPENGVHASKLIELSGGATMGARLSRTVLVSNSGRKQRWAVLCLLGVLIAALLVVVVSCGSGSTTSSSSQGAATTGSSQGAATTGSVTTTAGHADLQADLASPAQDVLNAVYSSVVNIAVSGTVGGRSGSGVGSGIVYTSDGYIMTNDHVVTLDGNVNSGQSITVTFSDGSQAPATIVGEDAVKDLAAIKVAKTGLNAVTFGKSSDVQLAEWATVIGSPLDFRNTVSLGIVSGLGPLSTGLGLADPDRSHPD